MAAVFGEGQTQTVKGQCRVRVEVQYALESFRRLVVLAQRQVNVRQIVPIELVPRFQFQRLVQKLDGLQVLAEILGIEKG